MKGILMSEKEIMSKILERILVLEKDIRYLRFEVEVYSKKVKDALTERKSASDTSS